MRVLQKILSGVLVLALLYGGLFLVERFTTQELTRVINGSTQEVAALIWKPRFLRGDGRCYLSVLNAEGGVIATAELGTQGAALDALQQLGQLGFDGEEITVANLQTGAIFRRFVLREGRLTSVD